MAVRSIWRGLRLLEHLITGAGISLYVRLRYRRGQRPPWLAKVVRWWHARLCRALGLRIGVEGRLVPDALLVGNHISWLDIPILGAQAEIGFLAKSEVREWPLIGWMAAIAGTLFIARGAHRAETVSAGIIQSVAQGRPVMIFPEGTTTDGRQVRRFHPRLFAIAQDAELSVQPIAISYRHGENPEPDSRVPYIGDDTLIASLWRVIRHPDLVARIQFLPPIHAGQTLSRRALAERAHGAILETLGLAQDETTRPPRETAGAGILDEGPAMLGLDPRPACPR